MAHLGLQGPLLCLVPDGTKGGSFVGRLAQKGHSRGGSGDEDRLTLSEC